MDTSPFRIGVSGHQELGDESTLHFVSQQFRELLTNAQQHEQAVVLYSALAMGADQLFVRTALELGIPVEVVIPCAEYEASFVSEAARAEFWHLLGRCQSIHRLPAQACSDDAYLAAGQWIVEHCDLVVLAWNGLPPKGRGGTGDVASYARFVRRPFVHINTLHQTVKTYGDRFARVRLSPSVAPKQEFTVAEQVVYQGPTLVVKQYHLRMPNGKELVRDIVERPESVLVLPVREPDIVLLVEEYDLGAGVWQLKLPGGKVEDTTAEGVREQAQKELRQEIGYRAGRLEKLLDLYSHPGYVAHKAHIYIARDLEWSPMETETHEEIRVHTYTLQDALAATLVDYRCDPEAALALWLYAHSRE